MALFLDSSTPSEVGELWAWGVLSGVTTNPLILSREAPAIELEQAIRGVLATSTGHVSVELLSTEESAMLTEAATYSSWDPSRICIKVPFSEAGLRVTKQLVARGVPTNVTCMMSFNQAYLAALVGATYLSIFSGRVRDMGYDVRPIISDLRSALDSENLSGKILIGSIRHPQDVSEALTAGAHVVTLPPAILRKMLFNPQTERTIQEFNDAWRERSK